MSKDGFWYWMTLADPSYYFLAKALGGDAENQADAAMQDAGPVIVLAIFLIIVGVVIWGVGKLIGIW